MPITVDELLAAITSKNSFPPNAQQEQAIRFGEGPLWIIAGPGTGKTEVLVVRCLKLMCCDGIEPKSIMVTTFTEKAARSLQDRIADAMLFVQNLYPKQLSEIDTSQLRIGTLDSLCNEILQEFRYVDYQNLRLLDEVQGQMLIRADVAYNARQNCSVLPQQLFYLFGKNRNYLDLSLWGWTKVIRTLVDRLVENRIDLLLLQSAGGVWAEIAYINELYEQQLDAKYCCDFARLKRHFLTFLNTPQGLRFLAGDNTSQNPPLRYVLVDEYQDTNPIQEEIYFALAGQSSHNLTVCGDDDQALYRFRGGSVECMVGFGNQCQQRWSITPTRIALVENYRSDSAIVDFCNTYITSFTQMAVPNSRVLNKPLLRSASGRNGTYPAVGFIRATNLTQLAVAFANTVQGLVQNNIIQDYSQAVLLLRSVQDKAHSAGPYMDALNALNIPIYNPRSRVFLEQPEVQEALGALVSILDPNQLASQRLRQDGLRPMLASWVTAYNQVAQTSPGLRTYVEQSQQTIRRGVLGERLLSAAPTILYRILAHDPFGGYQANPEQDLRLSKLSRLLEAFSSQQGRVLNMDSHQQGVIKQQWLNQFYYIFCGYLAARGMDDDEDDEVICPLGRFPIMTIHQSKGLDFDFVFVGSLGQSVSPGSEHSLDDDLRPYRIVPPLIVHSSLDAAWHDAIRLHFVAYSRARYALVLLAINSQLTNLGSQTASFGGQGGPWVKQNYTRL